MNNTRARNEKKLRIKLGKILINLKLILTAAYIVSKSAVLGVVSVSYYNVA